MNKIPRLFLLYSLIYLAYFSFNETNHICDSFSIRTNECGVVRRRGNHFRIHLLHRNLNVMCAEKQNGNQPPIRPIIRHPFSNNDDFSKTLLSMFLISGPLGMSLDNYHGLFNVLEYSIKGIPIQVLFDDHIILKSAAWVPFLFASAGLSMTILGFYFDQYFVTPTQIKMPKWPKTFYSISMFSFQYYISGLLDQYGLENFKIHVLLAVIGVFGFILFDGSSAGLLLALCTAIAGPLAEIVLINYGHLYIYNHADFLGICSWILWIYFLGASAVHNLARSIYYRENLN